MQDDKSGSVFAVAIVFAISTWVALALRIYVRVEQIAKFGLDDKLVIVAQIFFTAYLVCQLGGAVYGTGRHLSDLTYDNAETALKFWFFCEVWYAVASTLVKVSICLTLRRVCVRKLHLYIVYALILWSLSLGVSFICVVLTQCLPIQGFWSLNRADKHCIPAHVVTSLTYAVSTLIVACDLSLVVLPWFITRDLAMPLHARLLVTAILALGTLGSIATVVRMVYIPSLEQMYLGSDGDFLYDTVPIAVFSSVEIGTALVCVSLSTLRPLVVRLISLVRSYTYGSAYGSYGRRYASSLHSSDSRTPIPLDTPTSDSDGFAGMTQFNATRAISSRYDRSVGASRNPLPDKNATMINTTKPLDSDFDNEYPTRINTTKPLSSSDFDDDYDESPRRYGPG